MKLKSKYNIGDNVKILFTQKDYEKKSVRRYIIDNVMEEWRSNSYSNLQTFMDGRICIDSSKKTLKVFNAIVKGDKICELSIFKRHENAKGWFKDIIQCLDSCIGAKIIGVEARFHHSSKICPMNISYLERPLYVYKVLIFGQCDNGRGGKNDIYFEARLLESMLK